MLTFMRFGLKVVSRLSRMYCRLSLDQVRHFHSEFIGLIQVLVQMPPVRTVR